MATPLAIPSAPPLPWVWRAISSLRFLRTLLGIPGQRPAVASAARAPVSLGLTSFDWDGPDTSLTQAELEVLK